MCVFVCARERKYELLTCCCAVLLTNLAHHMPMTLKPQSHLLYIQQRHTLKFKSSQKWVSSNTENTSSPCSSCVASHPLLFSPPFLRPDVEQMAIDWLTGNFYFVDDVDDRIFVCDKDGQTCVTLLDQELYNPKGIALDPTMGSVWSLTLCLSRKHTHVQRQYTYVCYSECKLIVPWEQEESDICHLSFWALAYRWSVFMLTI